jgi:hypothetical protein
MVGLGAVVVVVVVVDEVGGSVAGGAVDDGGATGAGSGVVVVVWAPTAAAPSAIDATVVATARARARRATLTAVNVGAVPGVRAGPGPLVPRTSPRVRRLLRFCGARRLTPEWALRDAGSTFVTTKG